MPCPDMITSKRARLDPIRYKNRAFTASRIKQAFHLDPARRDTLSTEALELLRSARHVVLYAPK